MEEPERADARAARPGALLRPGLAVVFALFVAVSARLPVLEHPFFTDDYYFLEQVRGKSLSEALATPDPLGNFARPVSRTVAYWSLSRIAGENPVVFHAFNLALFAVALVLLFLLVRALAGPTAGLAAALYLGLHYAADVPLAWAAGVQDLLALVLALAALWFAWRGWAVAAAGAYLLALLSKETVALLPVVTWTLLWSRERNLGAATRGTWLLFLVAASWGAWWLWTSGERPAGADALSVSLGGVAAAAAHLVQAAAGLEFRIGGNPFGHWTVVPLLGAGIAVALLWLTRSVGRSGKGAPRHSGLAVAGLVWALCGAIPVALVAPIWSAYFYLFALCGMALLLGVQAARLPGPAGALLVGGVAFLTLQTRQLDEFAAQANAWAWQSHVNGRYLERALARVENLLAEQRALRPQLPPRSTVFYAELPPSVGFQFGDGPLLRWAYADTSLRSYYLTEFTRSRVLRGPAHFLFMEEGHLADHTDDPALFTSLGYSALLAEKPEVAAEAFTIALERGEPWADLMYWRALASMSRGDSLAALSDFREAGIRHEGTLDATLRERLAAPRGDTLSWIRALLRARDGAVLDPWPHGKLAMVCLATQGWQPTGVVESYAYRVLLPEEPLAWRNWAAAQLAEQKHEFALHSLETYAGLVGGEANADPAVRAVLADLRRVVRGDLAREELRR